MAAITARWHRATSELPQEQWQELLRQSARALPASTGAGPFFDWLWLQQLETSGSIVPREGWQACHLSLWRGERLVALAPLYLKGHSYGEFVFDQSFARLAAEMGLRYYPKLVGMSPVSPIQGYRFHIAAEEDPAALTALMFTQIDRLCRDNTILSCNLLYVDPAWQPLAEAAGCATWLNQQSQWLNPGHRNFEDYLAGFNANQRRNIRRERRSIANAGVQVTPLAGEEIPPQLVGRMHDFYEQHCARWGPWGSKYLTKTFFEAAARELRQHLVLFSAHRGDPLEPLAMSLCVHDDRQLWGRYWGADEEVDNLHFEVCYYAPIAWAIERGLVSFDPGAGGSHKLRRGFIAQPRVSLHRWLQPGFDAMVRRWLPQANQRMLEEIEAINAELPFTPAYDPLHGFCNPSDPSTAEPGLSPAPPDR
ncbi:MAG: GNAT family N-acetyltransferase [Synechococcaceae cyanobacterium]|nr:GNAT family N-acetyltransferase [Synechococcaceae cyanobacterium]